MSLSLIWQVLVVMYSGSCDAGAGDSAFPRAFGRPPAQAPVAGDRASMARRRILRRCVDHLQHLFVASPDEEVIRLHLETIARHQELVRPVRTVIGLPRFSIRISFPSTVTFIVGSVPVILMVPWSVAM